MSTLFWSILSVSALLAVLACGRAAPAEDETLEIEEKRIMTPVITPIPADTPEPTPTPEVWCRYPVPLADDLQKYIIRTAREYEIDPCIVIAVIGVETGGTYDPSLIGDDGHSFGLMQIWKSCHEDRMERLGVTDLLDPYQNVTVGIDILAELLDYYDGDMDKVLSFYHGNGGAADPYALTVQQNAECLLEGVQIVTE